MFKYDIMKKHMRPVSNQMRWMDANANRITLCAKHAELRQSMFYKGAFFFFKKGVRKIENMNYDVIASPFTSVEVAIHTP